MKLDNFKNDYSLIWKHYERTFLKENIKNHDDLSNE